MSVAQSARSPSIPVLIATKLRPPQVRAGSVVRRELLTRLVANDRKLTLVCAPAGWGKTTALAAWCAAAGDRRFAWISLDRGDDDPVRFWSYLLGALQTVDPELGRRASAALPAARSALMDVVLPPLLNELAAFDGRLVLVLDDYHSVRDTEIHTAMSFLLRHLPETTQVAIASRADPPLPLAAMRAADEVTELRAAELRFDTAETDALLNGSLGLGLAAEDVELLQARTEGWAAGLQLAALSAQSHQDKRAFVRDFAGDDRQIGDYLHELLAEQPADLREFLLQTSILDRLCAPLCDAVTGRSDSRAWLGELAGSNLFLVPLDSRGRWFRYHQLFRDLLRSELTTAQPAREPELHRRAAHWHAAEGDAEQAIAHATAAGDVEQASEIIVRSWSGPWDRGEIKSIAGWIDALPRAAALSDPRLCLIRAWAALFLGRLDEIEAWRAGVEPAGLSVPVQDGIPGLVGNAAAFDASFAYRLGDLARAREADRRAVAAYSDAADPRRAFATVNLGETSFYGGDLAGAASAFEDAIAVLSAEAWPVSVISAKGYLAAVLAEQGDLRSADRALAGAEGLIEELGLAEAPCARPALVARGRLCELRDDLGEADAAFGRAVVLGRRGGWPIELGHALLLHAALKRRLKHYDDARRLAHEARSVLARCPDPGVLGTLLGTTERTLQLTAPPRASESPLTDPELSERELTVLRLLASDLTQREIGSELYVSFNTVKGHTRSIFRKLGVANRAGAVARGRQLGLL